jgi:hypothetical protein
MYCAARQPPIQTDSTPGSQPLYHRRDWRARRHDRICGSRGVGRSGGRQRPTAAAHRSATHERSALEARLKIRLKFLGAAENVTGSRFLLEADEHRFLIDCGMHQERNLRERDWASFPVEPSSIDAVLITHAHLDHCGYLPKLVREGFSGPVYCTPATAEIIRYPCLIQPTCRNPMRRTRGAGTRERAGRAHTPRFRCTPCRTPRTAFHS